MTWSHNLDFTLPPDVSMDLDHLNYPPFNVKRERYFHANFSS